MRKRRKHYTAEQKLAIVRRRLIDKALVSELWACYLKSPRQFSPA